MSSRSASKTASTTSAETQDTPRVQRALLSVYDKEGIVEFAKGLAGLGVQLVSTGGTAETLKGAGLDVDLVEEVSGFPEVLDGRVKTLQPEIHAALLARRDVPDHMQQLTEYEIEPIDLVVVNLYPFAQTIMNPEVTLDQALEQMDIGGVCLIRSAVKNFRAVGIVTDIDQYQSVLHELTERKGQLAEGTRWQLAIRAMALTARYDQMIHRYLSMHQRESTLESFSQHIDWSLEKVSDLRYGENPHQRGAAYRFVGGVHPPSVLGGQQHHGKELSYNNLVDLDAALEIVRAFDEPSVAIVKHSTPAGVAAAKTSAEAFRLAHTADAMSAFGGIVGLNRPVDETVARIIIESGFLECVVAPEYSNKALAIFREKKNLRIVQPTSWDVGTEDTIRWTHIAGGLVAQRDPAPDQDQEEWKVVTKRAPTPEEDEGLRFAWKVVEFVTSNAIVLAKGKQTVGIGAGQMSRVDAVDIAVRKAGGRIANSVLASDAFFPHPDGVELAAKAGVTAMVQPGGSVKDDEVIAAADANDVAMIVTGKRVFRH